MAAPLRRILVALAEEDGTVLDRFIVIRETDKDLMFVSDELRDYIERRFAVEDSQ